MTDEPQKHTKPKQLNITILKPKDEFHPGGFIFKIIDNNGTTVLKEYWDSNKDLGVQFCRNWLKIRAGEELEFYTPPEPTSTLENTQETPKEPDAKSAQVG